MTLLFVIIGIAIIFDLINGFHDAANSIATVVSTKVLTPFQAVLWAAFFNFLAYWIFKLNVADSVAKVANTLQINLVVILCGLLAAVIWDLLTWWLGIPSSSSHALIGGFAGAAVAHAGFSVVNIPIVVKIILFIFLAPIIGMIIAMLISVTIIHICKRMNSYKADKWFRRLQLLSSAALSLTHGGNDSQKTMGIIAAAVVVYVLNIPGGMETVPHWLHIGYVLHHGKIQIQHLPEWIPFACYTAMGFGTMIGGWRIVKTMGTRITKLTPFEGVGAETAGAITLFITESLGIPVSTTHTISGSIMGVGAIKRLSAVRWGVSINLLWAWILTIPVSASLAALFYWISLLFRR
ncbi:MAG: inorganic phosphate transporter [Chitinophagaceae bacterium]|nr:MAG: inorganic phosphate transporter [Chitinophagaceae bacterium]